MNYTTYMYSIDMKEVILMIYIILTIIAVLLSTLIMGVANKYTNKKIHDINHELNIHRDSPMNEKKTAIMAVFFSFEFLHIRYEYFLLYY